MKIETYKKGSAILELSEQEVGTIVSALMVHSAIIANSSTKQYYFIRELINELVGLGVLMAKADNKAKVINLSEFKVTAAETPPDDGPKAA